jgi:hypothetical protein
MDNQIYAHGVEVAVFRNPVNLKGYVRRNVVLVSYLGQRRDGEPLKEIQYYAVELSPGLYFPAIRSNYVGYGHFKSGGKSIEVWYIHVGFDYELPEDLHNNELIKFG